MAAILDLHKLFVSKYPLASSFSGQKVLLVDELNKIKDGQYKMLIDPCRLLYQRNLAEYKNLKSKLPAITFCGVFDGPHKAVNLIEYNNLVIVDIDHISTDRISDIKATLFKDVYTFACWVSPSGNGVKLLIRVCSDVDMHKFTFDRILDHFYATYGIEIDTSGSDISRLCYISYDEDLLLKHDAEIFPSYDDEWLISLIAKEKNSSTKAKTSPVRGGSEIYTISERILYFKTEGRNNRGDKEMIKKVIIFLRKTRQTITNTYQNWFKVALAISNTFTYDVGKDFFLEICRFDGPLHDEGKSEYLIQYCYRKRKIQEVNFRTIIFLAQQRGFIINMTKKGSKT